MAMTAPGGSTASGLPDFRYRKRLNSLTGASPNPARFALAARERSSWLDGVITQLPALVAVVSAVEEGPASSQNVSLRPTT